MNSSDAANRILNDPELRQIYHQTRLEQLRRHAASPRRECRPDREILIEIQRLGQEQAELLNADYERGENGKIDRTKFHERHRRIREISQLIAECQRELSGLSK